MKIIIEQMVKIYEVEGHDGIEDADLKDLKVNSHWSNDTLVVLSFDGHTYAINGNNLKIAIDNAMNSGD